MNLFKKLYERQLRVITTQDNAELLQRGLSITNSQVYQASIKQQAKYSVAIIFIAAVAVTFMLARLIINLVS